MKKLLFIRRLSQVFFLGLFIYILWSTTYPLSGVLPPETFFNIDPLVMIFISLSERVLLPGIWWAVAMLVATFIFGRFFCGWICPLGTLIDGVGTFKTRDERRGTREAKCKTRDDGRGTKDEKNKNFRKIKFYLLAVIAIGAVIGIQLAWIFDPLVIAARFVSLNLIPTVTLLVDRSMSGLIQRFDWYGAFYDMYRALKMSVLGVQTRFFTNSGVIFLFFTAIMISALVLTRFWCRVLCPLGALYALAARYSLLRRVVAGCRDCQVCRNNCRMGAINNDMSYVRGECILCMDCVYDCPVKGTAFSFRREQKTPEKKTVMRGGVLTRRNFLFLCGTAGVLAGMKTWFSFQKKTRHTNLLRPPGVYDEEQFLDQCIRCGNCMKVCITNGLQPALLEAGLDGIWTPHVVPEIGYCEYNCTLCGNVCPTGAIPRLSVEEKHAQPLGVADIDKSLCLAWEYNEQCLVCEEHCPVAEKAIKAEQYTIDGRIVLKPVVDPALCVGCGICQTKCPARPERAIRVISYA